MRLTDKCTRLYGIHADDQNATDQKFILFFVFKWRVIDADFVQYLRCNITYFQNLITYLNDMVVAYSYASYLSYEA